MTFVNPSRPYLHLPRHLHIARWVAIVVFLPVSAAMAFGSVFLWQLSRGPVDVTLASRLFAPVPIASGSRAGRPAGRLVWSRLMVAWQPASRGIPSGLVLDAKNLRILRLDGTVADHADEVRTVLSLAALTRGVLAPRTLSLRKADFALHRGVDGGLDLDLPNQKRKGRGTPIRIDRLTALDVQDVSARVSGLPGGETMTMSPLAAHFRVFPRHPHGDDMLWAGWARATLGIAGESVVVSVNATADGAHSRVTLDTTPVRPAALAAVVPDLAPYAVPVDVHLTAEIQAHGLSPDIRDIAARLHVGAGRVAQESGAPLLIEEADLGARVTASLPGFGGEIHVDAPDARAAVADGAGRVTHVHATLRATLDDLRAPRRVDGDAGVTLDGFDFATVGAIWPQEMMRGARRWVVRNIVEGTAQGLEVRAHLHSGRGIDGLLPTRLSGALDGHDLKVWWLRPVAPATGLDAHLSFDGPDALTIDLAHGRQPDGAGGTIEMPAGRMQITGLLDKDQGGVIDASLTGALPSFLRILGHPRLHLLSRRPLPFTNPAGDVAGRVHLSLPLRASVNASDIHVQVQADYRNVHLGSVLLGRAVDGAAGHLEATEDHLTLAGDGRLSGVPTHVNVTENFADGAPDRVVQDITGSAILDPRAAVRAGVGPDGLFTGTALLGAHYTQRANDVADVALSLDLAHAGLTLPIWSKPEGEAAEVSVHLGLDGHGITALDALQAHGRALDVAGRAVLDDGAVRAIVLEGFRIGRSEGSARIGLPVRAGGPVSVGVVAGTLDLAPLFVSAPNDVTPKDVTPKDARSGNVGATDAPGAGRESGGMPAGAWDIDLHARHVFYGPKASVGEVVSCLVLRGGRLVSGRFSLEAPTHLSATLLDRGSDHPFVADVSNFGALLDGLGLYDRIGGGAAHLAGHFSGDPQTPPGRDVRDPGGAGLGAGLPPFSGTLTMGKFAILKPPAALTALSFLSPLQWPSDRRDRFEVERLSMPMRIAGRVLTLHDGVIGNAALGGTVQGTVDLGTSALALKGTIVPFFGLNTLPGRLPGVGRALAPERGGGVLAATFSVHGSVGEPEMSVNPLSMFLPGILRNIFR